MFTLNCKGKIITTDQPLIMGIINATNDSFFVSDNKLGIDGIQTKVTNMILHGADMIDVGGQSTRPGSERIDPGEERDRVVPLIKAIHEKNPSLIISVDTYYASVAEAAVEAGASIINDVSGGTMDTEMLKTVAKLQVPYICMHMKGRPENMQDNPTYEDVVKEILNYFIERLEACRIAGIHDVIIDPGFGFGKTHSHNFYLLKNLEVFKILQAPILAGLSRKGTIYKTLNITADDSLNGTTVLHTLALLNGADILRVHDVKEAKQAVTLIQAYKKAALL